MNEIARQMYGQPCRECGFSWDISVEDADVLISSLPLLFAKALEGHDGTERYGDAPWCATSYVLHVADNLRIWAERLARVGLGLDGAIVPYDQDQLALARNYEQQLLRVGLWSLDRATADWRAGRELAAQRPDAVLVHPEFGDNPVEGAVCQVAHDGHHHVFDVRRAVGTQG